MNTISNEQILEAIKFSFGEVILHSEESYGLLTITITKESNLKLISWLKEHKEFQFIFLTDICGTHYPNSTKKELGIIYHLHSFTNNIRIRIKIFTSSDQPSVLSLTPIFSSANWMERETYDFYGIQFEGHPNLKRILNVDEMDYFPMLKQYPLEDGTRTDKDDKYFGR